VAQIHGEGRSSALSHVGLPALPMTPAGSA
jgi:hypothetical protein